VLLEEKKQQLEVKPYIKKYDDKSIELVKKRI
jgi:hypothetical protein